MTCTQVKSARIAYFNICVTNVFNDLPPPFAGLGQNYDPIGRFYRLGMKVEF